MEAGSEPDTRPRATHYPAHAVYELRRAACSRGYTSGRIPTPKSIAWRKLNGTFIAGFNGTDVAGYPDEMTCLPLEKATRILHEHVKTKPSAKIDFNHKGVGVGQEENECADVESADRSKPLSAAYVVGCDGANSQVGNPLFGDTNFPGRTWDEQIVATNTYYDFDKHDTVTTTSSSTRALAHGCLHLQGWRYQV